jgi:Flp pilus assembly pilin Flp
MHDPLHAHDGPRASALPAVLDPDDEPDAAVDDGHGDRRGGGDDGGGAHPAVPTPGAVSRPEHDGPHPDGQADDRDEKGSLVTEYGLLAVVAATIAGVLIQWATGGAVINLFNALVDRARELVGA